MRKYFLLVIVATFLSIIISCSKDIEPAQSNSKWKLVWEEDFNKKYIDPSKWTKTLRGRNDWHNYMTDDDAVYVFKDGSLVLRAIQNNFLPNDTAPYLTGGIYTRNKKSFGFGRLEIKAKITPAEGAWPAIWLLPTTGNWPDAGEIDIMERLNFDKFIQQTVHSRYTKTPNIGVNPLPKKNVIANLEVYNVYSLEKYQDSLVFFVNNQRTFLYPRIKTDQIGQFPFAEKEYYLILSMQLGGSWVGPINPNDLPVEMSIDWVRFYELNDK